MLVLRTFMSLTNKRKFAALVKNQFFGPVISTLDFQIRDRGFESHQRRIFYMQFSFVCCAHLHINNITGRETGAFFSSDKSFKSTVLGFISQCIGQALRQTLSNLQERFSRQSESNGHRYKSLSGIWSVC